jgi:hypothetical protein
MEIHFNINRLEEFLQNCRENSQHNYWRLVIPSLSDPGDEIALKRLQGQGGDRSIFLDILISYNARSCAYTKDLEQEACHIKARYLFKA